ncbi:MAG: SAM hydroxide adenosyltransferase [Candidatus Nanohaloarchaea archaeon]|nr:SAM hydroxide adenosyltransferase [Candidatus Nanohaloarchaea archaeon]
MGHFLHLIADYGNGDPAFSEVIHRLTRHDPDITVQPTSVNPFSSLATGFWIAQYGLHNPAFDDMGIYANTAPRRSEGPQPDNRGEELVYAELDSGIPVIAVDSGYTFSFVKDHLSTFREVNVADSGSQFRSRDFFPEAVIGLLNGESSWLGSERDQGDLPEPPERRIAHIDGYGNIKTTVRQSGTDLEPGDRVKISLNGVERQAQYQKNAFEVEQGTLALAPGSAGGDDPFLELVLRGDSAADTFNEASVSDTLRFNT